MDVFKEYKPVRNRIAKLARDDALAVIWAYCQYLQVDDFRFPQEIQVEGKFFKLDVPQKWISEWELELLSKEVILNGGLVPSKGRTLRSWGTLSEIINAIKDLESRIYRFFGSKESVLIELVRIAHRQFIWQANPPNSVSIIRYYKIFNRPGIDQICVERLGLTVWQIYMCGVAVMGLFLTRPALNVTFKSDIKVLPPEIVEKFLSFTSMNISDLRTKLKAEQMYDANFAYAYSSLRAYPLVKMFYQGGNAFVCPIMTLLYWRFTSGLYYELISDNRFANEFGEGFQNYVGDVISSACVKPEIERIAESTYKIGQQEKRTVDWIVSDGTSALFLECKSKRLSWSAKSSLRDLTALESDIDILAMAVVQTYKTLADYENIHYPNFPAKEGRGIYLGVVTPENWRMFGPVMLNKLNDSVITKLKAAGFPDDLTEERPYSIWAIEELEAGLQIINSVGIAEFMDGKLKDAEMRQWDWHGYMTNSFSNYFPLKKLFDKEYDEIFSDLYAAQNG
jgi:hypothetical protein